jgi:hypothetical protein
MIQAISQTLTKHLQIIRNHFRDQFTLFLKLEAIRLTSLEKNRHTVHYLTGSNEMLLYGGNI